MSAAHAFDFTSQFEVAADLVVVEHAEAVHDGKGMAYAFEDFGGVELEILVMAHGQDQGINSFHGSPQIFFDAQVL